MSTAKSLSPSTKPCCKGLDRLAKEQQSPNRSRAVQEALKDKLDRLDRSRLARECAKLDPLEEQQLAEEGFAQDVEQRAKY